MIPQEEIKAVDKKDMLGSIKTLKSQVREGLKLSSGIKILEPVESIIISGMGGSALPGVVMHSLFYGSKTKVSVSRDYNLPEWANSRTLVFSVSYSGNTEETIASYKEAVRKGCRIVAMASGGKLAEIAKKNETPFIKLPKPFEGFQPRAGIGYMFFAILGVLIQSRLAPDMKNDIIRAESVLDADKHLESSYELAEQIQGKIPLIYTSEKLSAAGYKWKIAFNENAKTHAFFNIYPEQNHNEINAFINMPAKLHVIMLTCDTDHIQIKKRMKITKELYMKKGVDVTEISFKGNSMLAKLFSAIMIGDIVSYFLAILYKTDPTPVEMVESLKKQL